MSERITNDEIHGIGDAEKGEAFLEEPLSVDAAPNSARLEGEKVEHMAGRRFPEHPLSGLLRSNVERFKHWINEKAPEDLYQEVAVFLLEHCPEKGPDGEAIDYSHLSGEQMAEVMSAFNKHLYQFMKDSGLTGKRLDQFSVDAEGERHEDRDPALADRFWEKYDETNWFFDHIELCKKLISSSGSSEPEMEWEAFNLYLSGRNPAEIGRITGYTEPKVRQLLEGAIAAIREGASIDDLPEWHVSKSHAIKIPGAERGNREKIYFDLDPEATINDVMAKFGVPKGVAYRYIQRAKENNGQAWHIPGYNVKKRGGQG